MPGSHYFNTPEGARVDQEIPLATDSGTVTIVNYDLWHRQMPNHTEHNRYMVKFLFARMSEPQAPSWNNQQSFWPGAPAALEGDGEELQKMYEQIWHWHCGRSMPPATNGHAMEELLMALAAGQERAGMAAAYDLAAYGEHSVVPLLERLADESETTRHLAACALSVIGAPAVGPLSKSLEDKNPVVRALAAEILGDIGLAAEAALPNLVRAAGDADEQVRFRVVEALGTVCQSAATAVPALIECLADEDKSVRRETTFALARLGLRAGDAVEALEGVLEDEERYVRGNALHALGRIGTAEAKDVLIRHLIPARWCPLTSAKRTF